MIRIPSHAGNMQQEELHMQLHSLCGPVDKTLARNAGGTGFESVYFLRSLLSEILYIIFFLFSKLTAEYILWTESRL